MTAKKPTKRITKTITKQSTKTTTKTVDITRDAEESPHTQFLAEDAHPLAAATRPEDSNLWIITSSAVEEFGNKTADPSDAAAITDFLKDPFGVDQGIVGQVERLTLRAFIQVDVDNQMAVHKDPFWVKVSTKKNKTIPPPSVWDANKDLLFYTSYLDTF